MTITVEELARREMKEMEAPDQVRVRTPVLWFGGNICMPCSEEDDADAIIEAVFKELTYGDNIAMEKVCRYTDERPDGKTSEHVDMHEMRRLIVKRNLLDWNIPIPINRENGWMTPESYREVGNVPAPLLDRLVDEFEDNLRVTEEEEMMITRQCSVLFGKSSSGVYDACEAVSLFCTMGNFSEKFNLDRDSLFNLPYREFVRLKIMLSKEGEANRSANSGSGIGKPSNTKIVAGQGGRVRPSQAYSVRS